MAFGLFNDFDQSNWLLFCHLVLADLILDSHEMMFGLNDSITSAVDRCFHFVYANIWWCGFRITDSSLWLWCDFRVSFLVEHFAIHPTMHVIQSYRILENVLYASWSHEQKFQFHPNWVCASCGPPWTDMKNSVFGVFLHPVRVDTGSTGCCQRRWLRNPVLISPINCNIAQKNKWLWSPHSSCHTTIIRLLSYFVESTFGWPLTLRPTFRGSLIWVFETIYHTWWPPHYLHYKKLPFSKQLPFTCTDIGLRTTIFVRLYS